MKTDEIRESFINFFKHKSHKVVESDSLIPTNDETLLFTGAGMNQFKEMFLGKGKMDYRRAVSCQKCLRTPDIERVGKTSAHHTFFEMLGNFSFGDYFKKEAIEMAWEYLTETLKLPADKLSVSVYTDDDESYTHWKDVIGVPVERIYKFGESENFWPANAPSEGPNGPCGPCTEIFIDQGADVGCGRKECDPSCDCDRYVEIWNLVFTQYERKEGGIMEPLPQKNIDTGMGLERIAAVMQKVPTNFGIDIFMPIIQEVSRLADAAYDSASAEGVYFRRIADHVRAVTFCISDGVVPSNEGRGYVVRRLLRRALNDGTRLGLHEPFLYKLVPTVVNVMKKPYPELVKQREHIARVVMIEEEKFLQTIDMGSKLLREMMDGLAKSSKKVLPGKDAFKLYDTYGFPIDLTEDILTESGYSVDRKGFRHEMDEQRKRARAKSKIKSEIFMTNPVQEIKSTFEPTEFCGYRDVTCESKVQAIIADGEIVEEVTSKSEGGIVVVLDKTPFYGESGGQVGDTGVIENGALSFVVTNVTKEDGFFLHYGNLQKGNLAVGEEVTCHVDAQRRLRTACNHSATHLLHYALRAVLGEHAEQRGSFVGPDRLRFDFTHFNQLTNEQIRQIEDIVNEKIWQNAPVETMETDVEKARQMGAMALFGEKYGETVRVVKIGDFSMELCGGTHLTSIGIIGLFKIVSEESVASGIRRITALTGEAALNDYRKTEEVARTLSYALKVGVEELPERLGGLQDEIKKLKKNIDKLKHEGFNVSREAIVESAVDTGKARVITQNIDNASVDDLRKIADSLVKKGPDIAVCLATVAEGKIKMILALGKELVKKGYKANALIREIAKIVSGGGGGRVDFAQAGGNAPDHLEEAFEKVVESFR